MKIFQCLSCRNEINISGTGPITLRCQQCDCRDLKVLEDIVLAPVLEGNNLGKSVALKSGDNFFSKNKMNDMWHILSLDPSLKHMKEKISQTGVSKDENPQSDKQSEPVSEPPREKGGKSKEPSKSKK